MELALTRPEGRRKGEFSFLAKVVAAILLVTAADWLFCRSASLCHFTASRASIRAWRR